MKKRYTARGIDRTFRWKWVARLVEFIYVWRRGWL